MTGVPDLWKSLCGFLHVHLCDGLMITINFIFSPFDFSVLLWELVSMETVKPMMGCIS